MCIVGEKSHVLVFMRGFGSSGLTGWGLLGFDLCRKMGIAVAFLVMMVQLVSAQSEWNTAHATFYGGSDAGGTEGTSSFPIQPLFSCLSEGSA